MAREGAAPATRAVLKLDHKPYAYHSLLRLTELGFEEVRRLPACLRILLLNLLHHEDDLLVTWDSIEALARWDPTSSRPQEIAFHPARVLLQDFTGVPAVVDLAAMRDAVGRLGGEPRRVNPVQPADLVIDHSVQVDAFGSSDALARNIGLEFTRNSERYSLLKWARQAFRGFRVVPPGTGIVHQVNLEYLAGVALVREMEGASWVIPDTLVGTDSHTTMINGLGVLGWGVGGIEAEAALLGGPVSVLLDGVVGIRLEGDLAAGSTATDLVLTITEELREIGVVGRFVEFCGPGLASLGIADRATISNMCPEYGATAAYFPVDSRTTDYLRFTGRAEKEVRLVEAYYRAQGLWRDEEASDPVFSRVIPFDLGRVVPSLAGPRRPQDRVELGRLKSSFRRAAADMLPVAEGGPGEPVTSVGVSSRGASFQLAHGSVVIAAITSCTNTSNPAVMIGAGLLAKKAVERGLRAKPWVKTSIAPGSRVVSDYLEAAGLWPYLQELGFYLVGYGCTTCIGNSGPLPGDVACAVEEANLIVAAVLSGNRNFEGRIHPLVRANYLASPPLVVAFALAGTVDIDLESEPLGEDTRGKPVFLRDIRPSPAEIEEAVGRHLSSEQFRAQYGVVFEGDDNWDSLSSSAGELFPWDPQSTYIKEPPFLADVTRELPRLSDIREARVLALLGDSVTTDHISPAGNIPAAGPAGAWLLAQGVTPPEFNSFGSRRGNHEVMVRGTFGNIRLRNHLVPGREGGFTRHLPSGEEMSIYDAALRYRREGVPLLVIAGSEYGMGSSRDWAAKGTSLLGVKAVLARSFERIHRSNLVGMGVVPLEFREGENVDSIGLTGEETFEIIGLADRPAPGRELEVTAHRADGGRLSFSVRCRIDTPLEIGYFRHGGILPFTLRKLLES